MNARRLGAVILVLVCLALAATQAVSATGEQTYPRVRPSSGHRHTAFLLRFTLRETPGHQGVFATSYTVGVTKPKHRSVACSPPAPPPIESGEAGTRVRVQLTPPARGWCLGGYRATVFLQRGPYCPPPEGQPAPCPEFPTQQLNTGSAQFTVRPRR